MSDWSNEDILNFLRCYQGEPCIWDPSNRDHKDKKKVADAWDRLSKSLNKPIKELKVKKDILMVTFRRHLKRKQECIRSGAGIDDPYEPTWFAYQLMESFLMPIYSVKLGFNLEMQSRSSETAIEETVDGAEETVDRAEETENLNSSGGPSTSAATVSPPVTVKSTDKSRRRSGLDLAEQQMATAFNQLTNVLSQRQSKPSDADSDDECDLYAKLLAKKIRELSKDDRKLMMYEIDGLFIQKIKHRSFSRKTPSPPYFPCTKSSSVPNAYVLPNRPLRAEPYPTSYHVHLTDDISNTTTPLPPPTPRNIDDNIYSNESNSLNPAPNLTPTVTVNIKSEEM